VAPSLEQEIRDLRSRFWSERDPDGRAFAPLADAFRRAGELDEALELLADGLGRHPDYATGHVIAAWVHRDRGDAASAETAYRAVLELDPENARALHGLGQLLARGGRVAAGRELVGRAVELDPLLEWEEGGTTAVAHEDEVEMVRGFPGLDRGAPDGEDEAASPAVVDVRLLAPTPVDGVLGDPDGRGAIVAIASLAPDGMLEPPSAPGMTEPAEVVPAPLEEGLASWETPWVEAEREAAPTGAAPPDDVPSTPVKEPSAVTGAPDLSPLEEVGWPALDETLSPEPVLTEAADVETSATADIGEGPPEVEEAGATVDVGDLTPEVEEAGATVDLGDLAPEVEESGAIVDIRDLAPDAEEAGAIVDIRDLAPDAEEAGAVVDIRALAPDGEEAEVIVDVRDLAPDADEAEAMVDIRDPASVVEETGAVAEAGPIVPDPAAAAGVAGSPPPAPEAAGDEASVEEDPEAIHYTRTMAELFARQGLHARAVDVLRHLLRRDPANDAVRARVAELEERLAAEEGIPVARPHEGPAAPAHGPGRTPEPHASEPPPELATPEPRVGESPGTILHAGEPRPGSGPDAAPPVVDTVAEYLRGLLAWPSRRTPAGDADDPRGGGDR
jgi:tetratricopeptide (TPR) repeat protein